MKIKRKEKIIIRADGSKRIGFGHLKRAILLSEHLFITRNIKTVLISKIDGEIIPLIKRSNVELVQVASSYSTSDEIDFIHDKIKKINPRFFVLDVLESDINPLYMNALNRMNIPIIAITDDSYMREINVDLILNGNPNQLEVDYGDQKGKYLLGPKYFLMSKDYANIRVSQPKKVKNLLLTLGGSDHNDLIFKTLEAIGGVNEIKELLIISSKAAGYVERLNNFLLKYNKKTTLHLDVPTLSPFFAKADIAITAGGNTLFERIASGVPGATICQLTRQMEIADCFERLGVNFNIGFGLNLSATAIQEKIQMFISDFESLLSQSKESRNIVDGKGLIRFCKWIDQLCERKDTHGL